MRTCRRSYLYSAFHKTEGTIKKHVNKRVFVSVLHNPDFSKEKATKLFKYLQIFYRLLYFRNTDAKLTVEMM